jgi:hypothetical protein
MLAREYCDDIKRKNKPIILSHRILITDFDHVLFFPLNKFLGRVYHGHVSTVMEFITRDCSLLVCGACVFCLT